MAGFRERQPWLHPERDQYGAAGAASFTYDANANLTSDGSSTFAYDIENRLVGVGGAKTATLRYDPMGRLYEVSGTSGITRFLYDGDALVGEYDTSGNFLRRYVHGAGLAADDPIAWYEGSGCSGTNERQMRPDWQGSISVVTDSAGASIVAKNSYDEYGVPNCPLVSGAPDCTAAGANVGRFQYTGQAWLPEVGMYHYKARVYSPTLGRFLQTDPIGYQDQVNLYAYVGNDPANGIDPRGLFDCGDPKGEDCKAAQAGVDEIMRAKKKYASQGTKQGDPAASSLARILKPWSQRS